jgi:hypothetical protein
MNEVVSAGRNWLTGSTHTIRNAATSMCVSELVIQRDETRAVGSLLGIIVMRNESHSLEGPFSSAVPMLHKVGHITPSPLDPVL